ncbi:hypothetical protein [Tenacibaculum sp. IB213877]|uniref:hypothetical protein n=1 Tax=Tenacibaculum sp. IB213877 TaxID=3097351 RepID=UPI002A5A0F56|nr:hypothetical protein [Tenacibaculum sp. IB213877]MDY0780804.1 hypothetical protein [Tenacibaculum sp. IB213877]
MFNSEFKNISEIKITFPNEQVCIYHLERIRWNKKVISPFDNSSKVYKCKANKYRCKNTGKYFNVRTGTMFDNTKTSLQKWFIAIWIVTSFKPNINSIELSKYLGISQKSAWFMLTRIKKCYQPN